MLGKKKIAGLLSMAALLAACGGGGGGDDDTSLPTSGSGTPTAGGGTPTTGGDTTQPPADNNQTPGNQTPDNQQPDNGGGEQATDTKLAGQLAIVANQLVFLKADRSIYNAIQLEEFETGGGLLDAAAGSTGTETGNVPPSATAPVAPIAALGFRIDRFVQPTTTETNVGSQTAVGRLALRLVEVEGSAGIAGGEVAEQLSFVLDGVELSTSATGELTGVRVQDGAQIHVFGHTAAGNEIRESLPAAAQSVRLLQMTEVLDHYGDTSSVVLLFDLEHAFAQAGSRLAGLELLSGRFNMDLTLSPATIVRPANTEGLDVRMLTGKEITVNNQPKVEGAGISGTAWIRAYP